MPKIRVEIEVPEGEWCGWNDKNECQKLVDDGEYCAVFGEYCVNKRLPQCIAAEVEEE